MPRPQLAPEKSAIAICEEDPFDDSNSINESPHVRDLEEMRTQVVASSTATGPSAETKGVHAAGERAEKSVADRRESFDCQLGEEGRRSRIGSLVERQMIGEVSGELRRAHEAFMGCLYADGEMVAEEEVIGGGDEHRWRSSTEQMRAVGAVTEDNDEDGTDTTDRDVGRADQNADMRMRGGGMSDFFGFGSKSNSRPQPPQMIRRPSEAMTPPKPTNSSINRRLEEPRAAPWDVQDPRLLRVQQTDRLAPPSSHFNDGSSSLAGSGRAYSIVPEGSIASWTVGGRSYTGTVYYESDDEDARLSTSNFPSVSAPSTPGDLNKSLPRKPISASFNELVKTGSNAPVSAQEPNNSGGSVLSGARQNVQHSGFAGLQNHSEKLGPVQELGSPMQSPVQNKYNWSPSSHSDEYSSQKSTASSYNKPPKTTFFAPKGHGDFGTSTLGSLRKHKRPIRERKIASPLQPLHEQDQSHGLFPPGIALATDAPMIPDDQAEIQPQQVDSDARSIWQGGSGASIAPEDSQSQTGSDEELPAAPAQPTSSKQNRKKKKVVKGEALIEVGETNEDVWGAKEKSKEQFRNEVRKAWGYFQTRLRVINDDMEKTDQEKTKLTKEEYKVLGQLIAQASADTGFEELHEPWQKNEFVRRILGIRSTTSRAPSFFRKINKVMKWILAVPDDPELKTWSSRKYGQIPGLDVANLTLQRRATNSTSTHSGAKKQPDPQRPQRLPSSQEAFRQFHFAPVPAVNAPVLHQTSFETLGENSQATSAAVKAGKLSYGPSVASSETVWPTQSQVGG